MTFILCREDPLRMIVKRILTSDIADMDTWNPAFDVTPAALITGGIITEKGVVQVPIDTLENMALLQL